MPCERRLFHPSPPLPPVWAIYALQSVNSGQNAFDRAIIPTHELFARTDGVRTVCLHAVTGWHAHGVALGAVSPGAVCSSSRAGGAPRAMRMKSSTWPPSCPIGRSRRSSACTCSWLLRRRRHCATSTRIITAAIPSGDQPDSCQIARARRPASVRRSVAVCVCVLCVSCVRAGRCQRGEGGRSVAPRATAQLACRGRAADVRRPRARPRMPRRAASCAPAVTQKPVLSSGGALRPWVACRACSCVAGGQGSPQRHRSRTSRAEAARGRSPCAPAGSRSTAASRHRPGPPPAPRQ